VKTDHLAVVPDGIDDVVAADQPILVIGTDYVAPTAGYVKRDGAAYSFKV
jgi:hypothetical protein